MMGKINVLSRQVKDLISAGEVVERPASVVKELVENSIDAGAKNITVEIEDGGVTYIRVADDGEGMLHEDVKLAFLKNATSKIKEQEDLDKIFTLGFRGEALASIAAVSHVELITRNPKNNYGTLYQISAGEEISFKETGAAIGSTFIVRDLFFNVPARLKFLKRDFTEGNLVGKILDKVALSHPEISFKFIKDKKMILNTQGNGNLKSAIYSVFGKDFLEDLMSVENSLGTFGLKGFVCSPHACRANRNMQHFFVNGRSVFSKTAFAALEEAFKAYTVSSKFPSCVLFINLPANAVDVNVHPAKTEVRFGDEKSVFRLLFYGVKNALLTQENPIFVDSTPSYPENKGINNSFGVNDRILKPSDMSVSVKNDILGSSDQFNLGVNCDEGFKSDYIQTRPLPNRLNIFNTPKPKETVDVTCNGFSNIPSTEMVDIRKDTNKKYQDLQIKLSDQESIKYDIDDLEKDIKEFYTKVLIGEVFDTYIVMQYKDKIILVDKHAAHERLIYENILKSKKQGRTPQTLVQPISIMLEKEEYSAVLENLNIFDEQGFEVEDFGYGSILVRSTPMYLQIEDIKDAITEIATLLLTLNEDFENSYESFLYKNVACRRAVKAGEKDTPLEIKALVRMLEEQNVTNCPHGRPIFTEITKKEIEKKFKRVL